VSDVVESSTGVTSRRVIPALGLAWSNLLTTRLMLSKTHRTITLSQAGGGDGVQVGVRQMEVLFAPHLPNRICEYVIDADGVKGLT
jgi:DNA-repair protein XRCC3